MIINPEVIVTPDCPTVQIREPRENLSLEEELPRIVHNQGWGVGTYFNVQFISHDRTKLLSTGAFVVVQADERLHTSDANPYQPMTKAVSTRKAEQIGEWWMPATAQKRGPGRPRKDAA